MAPNGRSGESPLVVLAAATPGDCFTTALEATRIAVKYRTPVIILSDGYLANGSEPWRIPDLAELPDLRAEFSFATANQTPGAGAESEPFMPYRRGPPPPARTWGGPRPPAPGPPAGRGG